MGRRPNLTFLRRNIQAHEKILNIVNQGIANQTAMKYHHTPVRIAITKNSTSNKFQRRYGEKAALPHCCWWECKQVQPLWKTIMEVPEKTKNRNTV